jgi:hypothetical protein
MYHNNRHNVYTHTIIDTIIHHIMTNDAYILIRTLTMSWKVSMMCMHICNIYHIIDTIIDTIIQTNYTNDAYTYDTYTPPSP